jgi:hypothetical protein
MSGQNKKQSEIKTKSKAWLTPHHSITIKLWLYRRALVLALGFIALNAVDAHLTNSMHRAAMAVGVTDSIEANPILQPLVGTCVLSFKGVLGAGAIGFFAWTKKFTPDRLCSWFLLGCFVMLGVIIWNMYSSGILG